MNDSELVSRKNADAIAPCRRVEFDEFSFDTDNKLLWHGAETVRLAPKSCEILDVLVENAPQLMTKEELMNRVGHDSFVEEANGTAYFGFAKSIGRR